MGSFEFSCLYLLFSLDDRFTKRTDTTPLKISYFIKLNKLNPSCMNNIFKLRNTDRLTREKYNLNLEIPKLNQATWGLRSYGPKIWNAIIEKLQKNLIVSKTLPNDGIVTIAIASMQKGCNIWLHDNRL